jgi:alpha-L-rhamnosidase
MMYVESTARPLAINTRTPRFSWALPLEGRARRQSAYRILVATTAAKLCDDDVDLWDSGRVESSQSLHVPYAGVSLRSNATCYWTVRLWDESGAQVPDMPIESFGTPLFEADDWHAHWIGAGDPDEPVSDPACFQQDRVPPEVQACEPDARAPMLRRSFDVSQPVRRARVYVCGLGLYELRLNGRKVGDDVLATPRTEFRTRVLYNTYDVTRQLQRGTNAIGLLLGNGWFNGQKRYWGWQMQWYGSPRAIVQLEIEHEDGSRRRVISDEHWRTAWSPITFNCIYDGETYDARLEQPGWDHPEFDDTAWTAAHRVPAPGGRLEPAACDCGRITERLHPVSLVQPEPGVHVYDLGRNITGWVRLNLRNTRPGDHLRLRFGEAAHSDGSLNNASNNRALQTDQYLCRGGDCETWEPRFTYHGFRYVELTGLSSEPDLDALEGCFVRTAVPHTGSFACGHVLINKIHRCTLQSLMCNVQMGVPTDDTQRPERLGWGGDAWACATAALYNLDMSRLYTKWIGDFRDQQHDTGFVGMITPQAGAEEDLVWSAAFLMIPWLQYVHHGDRRILEDNYPAWQRYLSFLERCGQKEVTTTPSEQLVARLRWKGELENRLPPESERGHLQITQWGDHLSLSEHFVPRSNQPLSIATAFYYFDVSLMARIAEALGHNDDATQYRELAERINRAFHDRFFDPGLCRYGSGAQSEQAWPLAFRMVADNHRQKVQDGLISSVAHRLRHLTTGYAGTRFAIQALAEAGRHDLIWKLATATSYPSWGDMLSHDRTTTCERWDGVAGSLNHAPLGAAIDEWFYAGLAGIEPAPETPGYGLIIFKPYLPADLNWAQASLRTMRGVVRSAWRKQGLNTTLHVTVPANSVGLVCIPVGDPATVREGDTPANEAEGVVLVKSLEHESHWRIGSGSYRFTFTLTPVPGQ